MTVRVAMWSGPRNISTAMMRSWGSRADTVVVDEPFYAHYLQQTGLEHPGAEEIIDRGQTDWRDVVASLFEDLSEGKSVQFQKQMTLHLLESMDRGWIHNVVNCFLIREPRDVITSYAAKRPHLDLSDLGFLQQAELHAWVLEHTGQDPPIVDARDVQNHPEAVLARLCERIGTAFDPAMLSWPPGRRDTDGIWAPHWYTSVEASTGFNPYREKGQDVPAALEGIYKVGLETYRELYEQRIRPDD
ncbi:MAG: HAD family hydrolase [Acidobacteriota bacterium]|nr:HAD family hydrolase [Acidobacteriota bacterium]